MALQHLPNGIYPPTPTFFDDAGDLDLATLTRHISWLETQPLPGVLALGSNGEAAHLDDAERMTVIQTAREALGRAKVLLAGAGDQSTRGTIRRCAAAAQAGADVAVILPPFAFPTQMAPAALLTHFRAVADSSPIPILIYNMPANTANLDLSAETIIELAQHPNIIGVKDSGGQVAKLATIIPAVAQPFTVLAGSGSFLLPTLAVGGHGAIAAVANVIPEVTARIATLWAERFTGATATLEAEAQRLQGAIMLLNQAVTAQFGVSGLKAALHIARGYGGAPRTPLLPVTAAQHEHIARIYHACVALTA